MVKKLIILLNSTKFRLGFHCKKNNDVHCYNAILEDIIDQKSMKKIDLNKVFEKFIRENFI